MSRLHRVLFTASLSAITLSTLSLGAPAFAAPASVPSGGTYVVVAGDFLAGIAAKNGVALQQLLAANKLTKTSVIRPGDRLIVPAGATPPPPSPAPATPASPAAGPLTHTVKSGEFLAGIANLHKVALPDLLAVNKLTAKSLILPGMKLALPAGAVLPVSVSTSADVVSVPGPVGTVVAFAYAQLGKPYRFFTAGPDTFDCSGLTMAAYAQIGIQLVHHSASQATMGTTVDFWNDPIKPGDLVFMATHSNSNEISHVGIAVDATHWIHAPKPGDVVRLAPIPPKGTLAVVRRLVP